MKFDSECWGCFAGLSCEIRIKILNLLREKKELTVSEIANNFELRQPTITHHLKYLSKAGILSSKKEGRKVFYSINPKCGWGNCEVFK